MESDEPEPAAPSTGGAWYLPPEGLDISSCSWTEHRHPEAQRAPRGAWTALSPMVGPGRHDPADPCCRLLAIWAYRCQRGGGRVCAERICGSPGRGRARGGGWCR